MRAEVVVVGVIFDRAAEDVGSWWVKVCGSGGGYVDG